MLGPNNFTSLFFQTFICCFLALAGLATATAQSSRFAPAPVPLNAVPVAAARPPARAAPPVAFAPARPYSFGYEVVDAEAGNAYGHREGTDDGVTKGEFRVVLPDTRTQIVR